ncbi:MAG TPA: hypothetical protein VKE70_23725, partial [Candidatus Solibacter sp.]|nr:hypothetical protein [Candidatus Solibacter sp.]
MTPDDASDVDEGFAALLAAYDEALARARTPDPPDDSLSPDLRPLFREACACLRLLDDDRLRCGLGSSEFAAAAGPWEADPTLAED